MSQELLEAAREFEATLKKGSGGDEILYSIIPRNDITNMYSHIGKADDQTADLFADVVSELIDQLDVDRGTREALLRIKDVCERGKNWDPALVRNNVFKAAHSLGMRLPSAMF